MLLGQALGLSAVLFTLGVAGVLLRRNAIVLFMCIELMLNAVNLSFVALAQLHGASGYVMVFFVMTVAAAEAAVGLAIIISIFRHKQTVDLGDQSRTPGDTLEAQLDEIYRLCDSATVLRGPLTRDTIGFAWGAGDPRLIPMTEFRRALADVLAQHVHRGPVLGRPRRAKPALSVPSGRGWLQ